MGKIFIISAEICAIILSFLCVYHYFANDCSGMVMFFSFMFAVMAICCHKLQKGIKFDFKLW